MLGEMKELTGNTTHFPEGLRAAHHGNPLQKLRKENIVSLKIP